MLKIRKNINNVIEKMNIKNSVLDYIRFKTVKVVWSRAKNEWRQAISKHFGMEKLGQSWMQEIINGKREKGNDNMEWIDREELRRK